MRLLTTFADAVTAFTDPNLRLAPPGDEHPDNHTLFRDGEPHDRLRRLVGRAFTPRRVETLRPFVEAEAARLVTALVAAGPPADLIADLGRPLSAAVISELIGLPPEDREDFRQWAGAALLPGDPEEVGAAYGRLLEQAGALVGRAPAGSLVADLATVRDERDGRLSEPELVGMVVTLVGAGYLAASGAIALGAVDLAAAGRLGGPVDAAVVDEVLRRVAGRVAAPMPRWAVADTPVAAAGDAVRIDLDRVHRDPSRWPDPDAFAPGGPAHLAFGRGPHHCLGAALARMELTVALTALGSALPALRLAVAPEDMRWWHGMFDSGPAEVPVVW